MTASASTFCRSLHDPTGLIISGIRTRSSYTQHYTPVIKLGPINGRFGIVFTQFTKFGAEVLRCGPALE